jgi:hypothetical protein
LGNRQSYITLASVARTVDWRVSGGVDSEIYIYVYQNYLKKKKKRKLWKSITLSRLLGWVVFFIQIT